MSYVRIAILTAVVLLVLGCISASAVYRHHWHDALAAQQAAEKELAEYQASATAVIQERIAAEQRTALSNKQREKATLNDYQTRLAALRAKYDSLQPATSEADKRSVPSASGEAPASAGADAGTPEQRFVGELRSCEEERERLRALQRWIRETQ